MALKRTYFHRGYAIVHRTFASEQTEEIFHQFIVNKVGDARQLLSKNTLEEAQTAIDQLIEGPVTSSGWRASAKPATA
jgi:hypothetical protein